MGSALAYRHHIDGLRAIAVMGVVIFHFTPSALPGGFVGVDVFFVISGFLITKLICTDIAAGRFSFFDFYARRVRRILPAFFSVSIVTAALAYFLLLPPALVQFSQSLLASSLFSANMFFYFTSGYFAPEAHSIPLLHYWSLGVEEQFYALFPLMMFLLRRRQPTVRLAAIVAIFAASLIASQLILRSDPSAAFYLLPFRAFELLTGSLVASAPVRLGRPAGVPAAATGLMTIFASMYFVSETTPFPGFMALAPCLGTAVVLMVGEESPALLRLLSVPLLGIIGRTSYSIYLVHWPLVVFGLPLFPDARPVTFALLGIAASIVGGWVSYSFFEAPFRKANWHFRPLFSGAAAAGAIIIAACSATIAASGFPDRFDRRIKDIAAYLHYDAKEQFREGQCFLRLDQQPDEFDTRTCIPDKRPLFVMWGHSYLAHLYSGLASSLANRGIALAQITAAGCWPILAMDFPGAPNCRAFNDMALKRILDLKPRKVIISSVRPDLPDYLPGFDRTLEALTSQGIDVEVIGIGAIFDRPIPTMITDAIMSGKLSTSFEAAPIVYDWDRSVSEHLSGRNKVRYVSMTAVQCPDRKCPVMNGGKPLYFDTAHLTKDGALHYGKELAMIVSEGASNPPRNSVSY
jgi:peptidoglycan/LPS O-acetylase OafA/YrhL